MVDNHQTNKRNGDFDLETGIYDSKIYVKKKTKHT